MKTISDKITKSIGILRKLRFYIPRHSLVTTYKSFILSQLEYADVVYDQPSNQSFCDKLETIQYNVALEITGAVRGTSKEKLYQELGLEYLSSRRWFKRLCLLHKILKTKSPVYLLNLIPNPRHSLNIRNRHVIPHDYIEMNCMIAFFFTSSN